MDELDPLRKIYDSIKVPEHLELSVKQAILKAHRNKKKKIRNLSLLAASLFFILALNTAPIVSIAFSEIPVLGRFVKVFVFRTFDFNEKTYEAHLVTPAIKGVGDDVLEQSLNLKYLEENKKLYENFIKDVEALEHRGGGHMGIDSGFFIVNDDDRLFTIGRYYINTVGSSSNTVVYDTVDHIEGTMVTLPSLFKDAGYVKDISEEIKAQMRQRMEENSYFVYWLEEDFFKFDEIDPHQNFYITPERTLVISFNKYEVAPGYMGVVEFKIPYDVLVPHLMSDLYIRP